MQLMAHQYQNIKYATAGPPHRASACKMAINNRSKIGSQL